MELNLYNWIVYTLAFRNKGESVISETVGQPAVGVVLYEEVTLMTNLQASWGLVLLKLNPLLSCSSE